MSEVKKKTVTFLILIFVSLMWLVTFSAAPNVQFRTILPSVLIYESPSLTSDTFPVEVPQGAVLETHDGPVPDSVEGTKFMWQKVTYTSFEGYVPVTSIYQTKAFTTTSYRPTRAKSDKMGNKIIVYSSHTTESSVVAQISDGTKLEQISDGLDYGDFTAVLFNGKTGFVKTENLTGGLSQNQILAIIISCSAVTAIATYILVMYILAKRKKSAAELSEPEQEA